MAAVAGQIHDAHGHVDVLINNAGVVPIRTFLDTDDDEWDWTLDTNLRATITATRLFLPRMLQRRAGSLVNVASLAGVMANTLTAYSTSKFAVVGFSESLAVEYGNRGIDVIVVCPGMIKTEMGPASLAANHSDPALAAHVIEMIDKQGVEPSVVAEAIVRGIRRPRFLLFSPTSASVLHTAHTVAPGAMRGFLRRMSQQ